MRKIRRKAARYHLWVIIAITVAIIFFYAFWIAFGFRPKFIWYMALAEFRFNFAGSLFWIPIIYAGIVFRGRGMLIMCAIAIFFTLPMVMLYGFSFPVIIINLLYLCIPLLIVGYINLERNWRNSQRRIMAERERERQTYVAKVFQAQEDERKRIAQELHDGVIHSLIILANSVKNLSRNRKELQSEQFKADTESIRHEILGLSDDLRRLTLDLRPGILDNIGFLPAIRWLVERLNQDGNIDAELVVKGKERKISHNTDVIVFRIVQEALNNVLHHSSATKVIATLEFGEERVKISIYDNGKGFIVPKRIDTLAAKGKLGLIGIQERARSIKGMVVIRSKPGKGTDIQIEFTA